MQVEMQSYVMNEGSHADTHGGTNCIVLIGGTHVVNRDMPY